jgi:ribokinase
MSFDPGRLYTDRGVEFLDKFLIRTDILLINQSELKHLITGKIENSRRDNEQINRETAEAAQKIQGEYGIDIVVVKMGDKGSYVTRDGKSIFTNAFKVHCVDTTGAGDAFNAGFIKGYLNNEDMESCAIKGNYVASQCVTEHGATDGLPDIIKIV